MPVRRAAALLAAVGLAGAAACSDDARIGGDGGPDARQVGPDAPPDAPAAGCDLAGVVDLTPLRVGNEIDYADFITDDFGVLDPGPECMVASGFTGGEKVHQLTLSEAARLRVSTLDGGSPFLDTVVYVRTGCADPGGDLACNDDAGSLKSYAVVDALPAGTTVYIIVDTGFQQLPPPIDYRLHVFVDPILPGGSTCDPTQQADVCALPNVCSVAGGGAPTCAPALGPPVLTAASARERQNGTSLEIHFAGADPDGDVVDAVVSFADPSGVSLGDDVSLIEIQRAGYLVFTPPDLAGAVAVDTVAVIRPIEPATLDQFARLRLRLVDSAGTPSNELEVQIAHPTLVGLGAACNAGGVECRGELQCSGTCAVPAAAAAACAAADAAPITAPVTTMVTLAPGAPDRFQGSCYWAEGHGEAVLRLDVPGPRSKQVSARTDVPPSSPMLDSYVYLRRACGDPGSEVACNDDIGPITMGSPLASHMIAADVAPGSYYLIVDGSSAEGGYLPGGDVGVTIDWQDVRAPGEPCAVGDVCATGTLCYGGTCRAAAAALADKCATAPLVSGSGTFSGTVTQADSSLFEDPLCTYFAGYPEDVYRLTLAAPSLVTLSTDFPATQYDTAVYVLDSCDPPGVEIASMTGTACSEDVDPAGNWRSTLFLALDPGTYTVVVDMSSPYGADPPPMGPPTVPAPEPAPYQLGVTVEPL